MGDYYMRENSDQVKYCGLLKILSQVVWFVCILSTWASFGILIILSRYKFLVPILGLAVAFGVCSVILNIFVKGAKLRRKIVLAIVLITGLSVAVFHRHYGGLWRAVSEGDIGRINRLIARGADVNAETEICGRTPLGVAVRYRPLFARYGGDPYGYKKICEMVKILLDNGANPNIVEKAPASPHVVDWTGSGPLHYGIRHRIGIKAVELLLAGGANPNIETKKGQPPLRLAVEFGRDDLIELLIEYGANLNWTDPKGKTLLQLALENGNDEIAELLREHGAKE